MAAAISAATSAILRMRNHPSLSRPLLQDGPDGCYANAVPNWISNFHAMAHPDSFGARAELSTGDETFEIFRLDALQQKFDVARLPYSLKVLLENLLRNEDGEFVTAEQIERIARWDAKAEPEHEIAYKPARVLMQDFTGVPAIVDLAAMRDAMAELGGDPKKINPLVPA